MKWINCKDSLPIDKFIKKLKEILSVSEEVLFVVDCEETEVRYVTFGYVCYDHFLDSPHFIRWYDLKNDIFLTGKDVVCWRKLPKLPEIYRK